MHAGSREDAGIRRIESWTLFAGILLAGVSLTLLGVLAVVKPDLARGLGLQWLAHTAIGKETGIPAGLAAGVPWPIAVLAAFAQDAVVLLIGYPLVAMAGRGALRLAWLHRLVERLAIRRDRFARRTEPAGVTLLALSLWVPFLPSGALVASLIARSAGYRPAVFLPVLVLSVLFAAVAYGVFFSFAFTTLTDPRLRWGAVLAMVCIGATVALAARRTSNS